MALGMMAPAAVHAGEERTIKVLTIWNETAQGGTQTLKALSDKYCEEHPEVKVEIEVVAQTDLPSKLSVLAASNALPDLFIEADTAQANTLISQGMVKSIDEFIKENGLEDMLSESVHDGLINLQGTSDVEELYVLPTEQNIEGFWYNKKMFEENGWEVPETMEQFMAICADAKEKGIQALSVDGVDKFYFSRLWGGYVTSKLGTDALIKANAGELSWSDDAFLEAYQWVQDLNTNGYMGAGVTTIDSATMNAMFLSGNAAMEYNGSWFASNMNDEEQNSLGEDIGFFGFPSVEGAVAAQTDYPQNYGTTWMIGSKDYDETLNDWLVYVFSGYGDASMETQGILSGFETKEEHEAPFYTSMVSELISGAGAASVWPEYKMSSQGMDTSLNNGQMLVLGEMTPEDFGAALDALYE
ncbi:MAG: extracellular solute-binding protein [Eubacteriales bacterium]|nr:extracellular solute-binding protein [Eubacteriales bacterium]